MAAPLLAREPRVRTAQPGVRCKPVNPVSKKLVDFDVLALWQALDDRRQEREVSWRQVMEEINSASPEMPSIHPMSYSTVQNIRKRRAATCQHALALIRWLDCPPERFLTGQSVVQPKPLPIAPPDRRPRWDIRLLADALDSKRRERGLTWKNLAQQLDCNASQVSGLRNRRYGISIVLAMRITQWLRRPAADFIVAANW